MEPKGGEPLRCREREKEREREREREREGEGVGVAQLDVMFQIGELQVVGVEEGRAT